MQDIYETPDKMRPLPCEIPYEFQMRFIARWNENPFWMEDEHGIDLSLIRSNLQLTPGERLRRTEMAANAVTRLQNGLRK